MMKIRTEMGKNNVILQGIIEASRKDYDREDGAPKKRGRGTAKDVVSAVERGGQVVAKLVPNATGETIKDFIKSIVNTDESHSLPTNSWLQRDR